jgi:hypothetical protein
LDTAFIAEWTLQFPKGLHCLACRIPPATRNQPHGYFAPSCYVGGISRHKSPATIKQSKISPRFRSDHPMLPPLHISRALAAPRPSAKCGEHHSYAAFLPHLITQEVDQKIKINDTRLDKPRPSRKGLEHWSSVRHRRKCARQNTACLLFSSPKPTYLPSSICMQVSNLRYSKNSTLQGLLRSVKPGRRPRPRPAWRARAPFPLCFMLQC